MIKTISLLLSLQLIGCAYEPNINGPIWKSFPITISFDTNVSLSFKDSTLRAIDEWEYKTNINLFNVTTNSSLIRVSIDLPENFNPKEQANTRTYWRGNYIQKSEIRINLANPCDANSLMLHELGHALGLKHTNEGVMYSYLSPTEIRTSLDLITLNYFHTLYYR